MAAQATEVCEKNGMNLLESTSNITTITTTTNIETIQTATTFANKEHQQQQHHHYNNNHHHHNNDGSTDAFINEKNDAIKVMESTSSLTKEIHTITNTADATNLATTTAYTIVANATASTGDTDINSKETIFTVEKKSFISDNVHSDIGDYNVVASSPSALKEDDVENENGSGDGGGNLTGSNVNLSGTGDLFDNIPEWKKELLQRRRTKIARTIGANQINNSSICTTKKDSKSTSPVMPLTKALTNNSNNNISNNTSKSSSHQVTNKILPTTTTITTIPVTTSTHHHQIAGAIQTSTQLSCSTGHYTTVNSLQSYAHQPQQQQHQQQQICEIGNLTTNTSQEAKSTTSFSSQSLSPIIGTFKSSEFNNSNSNSDLNNQSSIMYTESGFKCSSINNHNGSCNNNDISCSSSGSSNVSGSCRVTSQSQSQLKQHQNQLEQLDSMTSSSQEQLQHQQSFQLHSKHDNVKTSSCNIGSPSSVTQVNVTTNNNCNNSSFVKNPSVGKTSLNKANKYKLSAKLNSLSSNGSVVTSSQTKKMVAMQQMDINDSSVVIDLDFDPSEELQYGPGIVSKLRCRYLSLALRQSANKQRPPLDNLRRATSLNNLLDDDDDSNNGSVVDHVDHIENNAKQNIINSTNSTSVSTPDEFVANFQKNLKISEKDKQRSRQLKRGNDLLKRARSVEALLGCDKSWDNNVNNVAVNNCNNTERTRQQMYHYRSDSANNAYDLCSLSSAAEVTIEDKIIHAKERISCEKTPKRLTSIIDDTERPPPDVVKQTLKIFEATANRRGRGLSRNNGSGEVAAKVATYKSIISQEKPPIVFPKPPLSPKKQFKKPGTLDVSASKRIVNTNNSSTNITPKKMNPTSPISNLAKKFTNLDAFSETNEKNLHHGLTSASPNASGGHRAEITQRHRHNSMIKNESTPIRNSFDSNCSSPSRTPDLLPRKHFEHSLFVESLSPVTLLTKDIQKLKIESPQSAQQNMMATGSLKSTKQQNSEVNDSSDISDVEEQIKQVSKSTITKKNLNKGEVDQENILNKSSLSSFSSSSMKSTSINGNSLMATGSRTTEMSVEVQQLQENQTISTKQVCAVRSLLVDTKLSQQNEKSNSSDKLEKSTELHTSNLLNSTIITGSSIKSAQQRQNFEISISDVEEQMKLVSKTTQINKNSIRKGEINQENNLNKSSSSCISSVTPSSTKSSLPISSVNGNSLVTGSCTTGILSSIEHHNNHQQTIPTNKQSNSSELYTTDVLNANKTRDNLVISNLSQSSSSSSSLPSSSSSSSSTLNTCNNLVNLNQTAGEYQMLHHQRPALTSREIEKNLINEKKNEQAAIEANAAAVAGGSSSSDGGDGVGNGSSGIKWPFMKKKSSWSQQMAEAQNNSMVFNFKDRKEVPDYIENDGLLVKRRRELPKPNEPGFVLLGDLSVETSTDPDDSWTMGPPSPCDVEFENANIIIDGKSSIRYNKSKDVSLKVQFDDTLTSTFEYPSESSLLDDTTTMQYEITNTNQSTNPIEMTMPSIISETPIQHHYTKPDEIIKAPSQKLLGNVTLDYLNGRKNIILQQQQPQKPPLISKNPSKNIFNLNLIKTNDSRSTTLSSSSTVAAAANMTKTITAITTPVAAMTAENFVLKPPKRMKSPPSLLLFPTVPIGSAPLGSYTPVKAQFNTTFELGITRAPVTNDGCAVQQQHNINNMTTKNNGNYPCDNNTNDLKNKMNNLSTINSVTSLSPSSSLSTCSQQNGETNLLLPSSSSSASSLINKNNEILNNETESLPYLKPATDDHTVVYSEGSQKTDLLY